MMDFGYILMTDDVSLPLPDGNPMDWDLRYIPTFSSCTDLFTLDLHIQYFRT